MVAISMPLGLQKHVHRIQHQPTEIVLLQQVTEAQDRRLIRSRRHAKIDAQEPPQRGGLIQPLFHPRVRQVEPLLHQVHPW